MQIHELNNFTGTLGSGAYLAIDDGNDTGKISSQGLLAATEARIDNIIAGPAPSAQEVTDARLGVDGVVYPSLGDAIRDQVSDLKADLSDLADYSIEFSALPFTFTEGVFINPAGNEEANEYYASSDYAEIAQNATLYISLIADTSRHLWIKVCTYDTAKKFIARHDIIDTTAPFAKATWTNTNRNAKYVRITYISLHEKVKPRVYVSPLPFGFDILTMPTPQIIDLPKSLVAFPNEEFSEYVQENVGVSGAKGTIYKSGDYYCITYGENLTGTGTDIPLVEGNGVLAMKYKFFKLVNGVETEVSYGTIAQKGSTYKDYNGNTATSVGGWGLPSGIETRQYFTTAYTVEDTHGMDYTFSGHDNYGMTPCCCDVAVSPNGVEFSDITELSLSVSGVKGKFDLHRIDTNYHNYSYITTTPPCKDSTGWHWMQGVTNGIAYLTSVDGIAWDYKFTIPTSYMPKCEVTGVCKGGYMYFACRTNPAYERITDALILGKFDVSTGAIRVIYKLPFVASRAWIALVGSDILLFYTPADKGVMECIRICEYGGYEFYFWRWFTLYKECTWYISPLIDNGICDVIPYHIVYGYFLTVSGNTSAHSEYAYIDDYIAVNENDTLTINGYSSTSNIPWVKICTYGASKNFIDRQDLTLPSSNTKSFSTSWKNTNSSCKYVRITYRMQPDKEHQYIQVIRTDNGYSGGNIIRKIYAVGGNGAAGSTLGMTFKELSFDETKPYLPSDINGIN